MKYGAIYIAHNSRDGESVFKVGKTERSITERMKELTASTSNIGTYIAKAYFIVIDIDTAEKACHARLNRYRVQKNREFFDIPFPRLLTLVTEQIQPFSARDFIPSGHAAEIEDTAVPLSPGELLADKRLKIEKAESKWELLVTEAEETIRRWETIVHERVAKAKIELADEEILKWNTSLDFNVHEARQRMQILASVTIVSLFTTDPLLLSRSGIRGRSYGDIDLSASVNEPEVWNKRKDGVEFVKWTEKDDGRIGKISIGMKIENATKYAKGTLLRPAPVISVRATPIRYDDYDQNFKKNHYIEKSFRDPQEAFEVFLSLVVHNCVRPQYDVRTHSGRRKNRSGEIREKILDRGKFEVSGLKK